MPHVTLARAAVVFGDLRPAGWHGTIWEDEYQRLVAEGAVAPEPDTVAPAVLPVEQRATPYFDEDDRTTARLHFDEPDPQ